MSDRSSHQKLARRRNFVPGLNALESRCLLSSALHSFGAHPDVPLEGGMSVQTGTLLVVTVNRPTTNTVKMIRGTAVQNGTELTVTVNKPVSNTVIILDEGGGTLKVESDDGSAHVFEGVTTIQVHAERARHDRIIFYTPSM